MTSLLNMGQLTGASSAIPNVPPTQLTGLSAIDALIAKSFSLLGPLQQRARNQTQRANQAAKAETRLNRMQLRQNNRALRNQPAPSLLYAPPPSMNNADASQAADAVRRSAATRNGLRRSIIAGENLPYAQ